VSEVVIRRLGADGAVQVTGIESLKDQAAAQWAWVDVVDPDETTMRALERRFELHELAVEDALHLQMRPKLDSYVDGFFLVWLTPQQPNGGPVEVHELDVFVGTGFLITVRKTPMAAIDYVAGEAARIMVRGQDWVLHAILDHLVDSVLPIVDGLGDKLDDVEDVMLGEPRKSDIAVLYAVRRQLVRMRRIIGPERDLIRSLARERDLLSEESYRYFQDIGDHLARVEDSIETYREVAAAVMDIYLSAQSNRMNEIMKALTVVATIFMPLTLLSGIYGMNVVVGMWPPVMADWSFAVIVGSMLAIAVGMSIYFRRKKWW